MLRTVHARKVGRSYAPVFGALLLAFAAVACTSESVAATEPTPDDQQLVRTAVDKYFNSLTGDFDAFRSVVCDELVDELLPGVDAPMFEAQTAEAIHDYGRPIVDWFDTVAIAGDKADVTLSVHVNGGTRPDVGAQTWTATLERREGAWLICEEAAPDRATTHRIDVAVAERDAVAAVRTYDEALEARDYATAKAVACGVVLESVVAEEAAPPPPGESLTLVSIDDVTVNGVSARVKLTVAWPDGVQQHFNAVVNNDSGVWKVCDFV